MKLRSIGWILLCAGLAIIAAQPCAKWLIRGELERVTGARLSASRFQLHPFTGRMLLEQAEFAPSRERPSVSLGRNRVHSPILIGSAWLQGSLIDAAYRRLHSPVAIMNQVSVTVSEDELQEVPHLQSSPARLIPSDLLAVKQSIDQQRSLDALFEEQSKLMFGHGQTFGGMDIRLTELEALLHRADNPLRNATIAVQTQNELSQLAETLASIQVQAKSVREVYQETSAKIIATHRDSYGDPAKLMAECGLSNEDADKLAVKILEHVASDAWESLRPSLGLVVRFLTELDLDSLEGANSSKGSNYMFTSAPRSALHIERMQMNGQAAIQYRSFPFVAQFNNIGGLGIETDDTPTLQLEIPAGSEHQDTGENAVLRAQLTPDRAGFLVRGTRLCPENRIVHASVDALRCEVSSSNRKTAIDWIVHQNEWKLDMEFTSPKSAIGLAIENPSSMSRVQTMLGSNSANKLIETSVAIQAHYEGRFDAQGFTISTQRITSPGIAQLSKAILNEHQLVTKRQVESRYRECQELLAASIKKQQSQLKQEEDRLETQLGKISRRLKKLQGDVFAMQSPRTDLRFSKQPSQSIAR